jgi:hypothetical protein
MKQTNVQSPFLCIRILQYKPQMSCPYSITISVSPSSVATNFNVQPIHRSAGGDPWKHSMT